jgi:hypothetical protein
VFKNSSKKSVPEGWTSDAQTCDDAAALAQKGLTAPKPADTSDDDWKKQTDAAYSGLPLGDCGGRCVFEEGLQGRRR